MQDTLQTKPRRRVRGLVALIAATAVVAFATVASAAQASEWNIETSSGVVQPLSSLGSSETFSSAVPSGSSIAIKWVVSGLWVETQCSTVTATQGTLTPGGNGSTSLKFTKCVQTRPVGCGPPASITTNSLAISTAEFEGQKYLKFTPKNLEGVVGYVTLTGECALAGTPYKIKGSFGLASLTPGVLSLAQNFEGRANLQPGLEIGGNPGLIIGGPVEMSLSGKYAGKRWDET